MTLQEFSNEFDILINSYFVTGNYQISTPVDLDDYEKSVLLTKAQNDIVKQIYNGTLGIPFEGTEEARRYLDALVCEGEIKGFEETSIKNKKAYKASIYTEKPVWFIVYESATLTPDKDCCKKENCYTNREVAVVPTRLDELERTIDNPFRMANSNRVLRIDSGKDSVTLIPPMGKAISQYNLRYIKKPSPIILVDLEGSNLSIDGETSPSNCELNSGLHRTILETAIRLALNKIENSTPKQSEEN